MRVSAIYYHPGNLLHLLFFPRMTISEIASANSISSVDSPSFISTQVATPHEAYLARAAAVRARSSVQSAKARHQLPSGLPTYNYLLCAANRRNYLATYSTTDAAFYEQVMQHRDWASLDEEEEEAYEMTQLTGDMSFLVDIHTRPRVFCTLHLGSYRLINHFLVRHGVQFTLVVDNATLEQQGAKFLALHAASSAYAGCTFRILNAESASIGLQMIREIKAGRSLLFYIDGNTGVGGMGRQDEKVVPISFLDRHILARKGIAFLAHVTRSPIVPVAAFRHDEVNFEMHFFVPIVPDAQKPREAFAAETTQHIFDLFATLLRRYPEQWEGWLYMNHFVDQAALHQKYAPQPGAAERPVHPVFNQERYAIFCQADSLQLFDQFTYQSFNISEQLAALLRQLDTLPTEVQRRFTLMPVFQDLCNRQVIMAASVA